MFKIRMQGQYGGKGDKRLAAVLREMWTQWGVRKGIMRGFWVHSRLPLLPMQRLIYPTQVTLAREIPAYAR